MSLAEDWSRVKQGMPRAIRDRWRMLAPGDTASSRDRALYAAIALLAGELLRAPFDAHPIPTDTQCALMGLCRAINEALCEPKRRDQAVKRRRRNGTVYPQGFP